MGDEEVGEIRFLTIDGNLTTTTAPIVVVFKRTLVKCLSTNDRNEQESKASAKKSAL